MSASRSNRGPLHLDQGAALLAIYDVAVGDVYGYLRRRSPDDATAQDITSETFLAAVDAIGRREAKAVTVAWLIGIARHKLVDHWRRTEREDRKLAVLEQEPSRPESWDAVLDPMLVTSALGQLNSSYRAALTFRYLDDLPVRQVAALLGRPEQATEAVLTRARTAFRVAYELLEVEANDV